MLPITLLKGQVSFALQTALRVETEKKDISDKTPRNILGEINEIKAEKMYLNHVIKEACYT